MKDKYSPVLFICIALLFVRCTEQSSTGRNSGRPFLVGRNAGVKYYVQTIYIAKSP